jgi:hypothetical protein
VAIGAAAHAAAAHHHASTAGGASAAVAGLRGGHGSASAFAKELAEESEDGGLMGAFASPVVPWDGQGSPSPWLMHRRRPGHVGSPLTAAAPFTAATPFGHTPSAVSFAPTPHSDQGHGAGGGVGGAVPRSQQGVTFDGGEASPRAQSGARDRAAMAGLRHGLHSLKRSLDEAPLGSHGASRGFLVDLASGQVGRTGSRSGGGGEPAVCLSPGEALALQRDLACSQAAKASLEAKCRHLEAQVVEVQAR